MTYSGAARTLVLRAKSTGRPEILADLARHVVVATRAGGWADACDVVAPIPGAPLRVLVRGFDPAIELARPVASALGLPLERRALRRRIGAVYPVKRMHALRRERALRGVFVAASSKVSGRHVLLIDDVVTTGSTARAATIALRASGASRVTLACWARTPL